MTGGSSGHPVDRLLRRVIRTGEDVTDADVRAIVQRVEQAEFAARTITVAPTTIRLAAANGFTVPRATDALTAHVGKHVWAQRQWVNTTSSDYLDDLRAAVASSTARIVAYERNRRLSVAVIANTQLIVPQDRRGPASGPLILVLCSPDNAMIVTGYMIGRLQAAHIPAGARWLR